MLHFDAETWDAVWTALRHLKQGFIYLNFTLAMLIFVPYMTLILLDLVVYIVRLSCDGVCELLAVLSNRLAGLWKACSAATASEASAPASATTPSAASSCAGSSSFVEHKKTI